MSKAYIWTHTLTSVHPQFILKRGQIKRICYNHLISILTSKQIRTHRLYRMVYQYDQGCRSIDSVSFKYAKISSLSKCFIHKRHKTHQLRLYVEYHKKPIFWLKSCLYNCPYINLLQLDVSYRGYRVWFIYCITLASYLCHGFSNHRSLICLFNSLFKLTSNITSELRISGHLRKEGHMSTKCLSPIKALYK